MPKGKADHNTEILEYALHHLELERVAIQAKIDHVQSQLGGKVTPKAAKAAVTPAATVEAEVTPTGRKKRVLSPAARKRIALAQKRRWAAHRKAKGE